MCNDAAEAGSPVSAVVVSDAGRMIRALSAVALILPLAACATAVGGAETRYFAYDPADALTERLTRGITLEVEKPLFIGPARPESLYATEQRGSAGLERTASGEVLAVLPAGSAERATYSIRLEGEGRGLARALCPGSVETWLVFGDIVAARGLVMHAVGRWGDGGVRHCARLTYNFRGEWATPQGRGQPDQPSIVGPR